MMDFLKPKPRIDEQDIADAKALLARTTLEYRRDQFSLFRPKWASREDQTAAFRIAGKRGQVGSPNCQPCHIKAWTMLHLIIQEGA